MSVLSKVQNVLQSAGFSPGGVGTEPESTLITILTGTKHRIFIRVQKIDKCDFFFPQLPICPACFLEGLKRKCLKIILGVMQEFLFEFFLYIWYLTCLQQLSFPNSKESHKFKDPSNVLTATINAAVLVSSLWLTLCVCICLGRGSVRLQSSWPPSARTPAGPAQCNRPAGTPSGRRSERKTS